MLAVRFNVFNTVLLLLALISSATADPVCDLLYGQPTYVNCRDLVLALDAGWPGQLGGRKEHYFSVRGERPPPWISHSAQGLRKYVPRFAVQG